MRLFAQLAIATAIAAIPLAAFAENHQEKIVTSQHSYLLTTVATGLESPWGLDFLPDGAMIVTERPGRLRIVSADGALSEPVANMPAIISDFRDGLLDVSVSPDFTTDNTIFFAFSNKEGDQRWLQVARAKLIDNALDDLTVIYEAEVKVKKDQGFGARIRVDSDGHLLVSVGDHATAAMAQDTSNTLGSIIRITTDGAAVETNPGGDLAPAIFAYGFKNPQGLTIHPETGAIWAVDHGGVGGGELNRVEAGNNYGWPLRTFGSGDAPWAAGVTEFTEPAFT